MTLEQLQALDPKWTYASATATVKQGVMIYVNGQRQRWEEFEKGKYRLVHERKQSPFDTLTAAKVTA